MTLARYAASNPAGVIPLLCLELSHSAWAAPERRVMQPDDWTVTIAGVSILFKGFGASEAGPWLSANSTTDDTATAQRSIDLDDVRGFLFRQIQSVRSSDEHVVCKIYKFLSTAPDIVLYAQQLSVDGAGIDGGKLTTSTQTIDSGNRRWPRTLHTLANTPGLRGRKS